MKKNDDIPEINLTMKEYAVEAKVRKLKGIHQLIESDYMVFGDGITGQWHLYNIKQKIYLILFF